MRDHVNSISHTLIYIFTHSYTNIYAHTTLYSLYLTTHFYKKKQNFIKKKIEMDYVRVRCDVSE